MKIMKLKGRCQRKRNKYNSYRGEVGKVSPNRIQRKFYSDKPLKKCYTDITEFHIAGKKVYLSAILDGFNSEIISYELSLSPNLELVHRMLDKLEEKSTEGMILHSDQGFQYQHPSYQRKLKEMGITQSMSRKGNSLDNGLMENFFGVLKREMFYDYECLYSSTEELIQAIKKYIDYYNNDRIKIKLNNLSPIEYRTQVMDMK